MYSPSTEAAALPEEKGFSPPTVNDAGFGDSDGDSGMREISMWMRGLRSFFNIYNHPVPEAGHATLITHDWVDELRILRGTLLRCTQLVFQSVHFEKFDNTIFDETDASGTLSHPSHVSPSAEAQPDVKDDSLLALAAVLGDACASAQLLLELRPVKLHAWMDLGEGLDRNLSGLEGIKAITQFYSRYASASVPVSLLDLTREVVSPGALGRDMLFIFSSLFRLLEYLRFVESLLRKDQSLKQTLPIFTLVHEEARSLAEFIETRALLTEELDKNVFDALDSTNYAIRMELRKVFGHELVGLSSLRQAHPIYIKVENAHGLLRDSFQQSVVGLAQLFNPDLDGAQLFDTFRTKLEQSLALRRDLWTLLQLVKRSESQPGSEIESLLSRLAWFREGSLRYLMYKDWEACERFMEDVEAARGASELTAVLHRFAAYLEALSGQVNMRAVLFNHPFDYPELKDG
jgi:hypothetical protein